MPDGFYITCECGYEVFIPEAKVGTEMECINCGADLDTHPSSVTPEKDSANEEFVAPFEPASSIEPKQRNSTYSSPFEEDGDDETDVPLRPVPPVPVSATPEPSPDYAASIFEDESDTNDDLADADKPDPSLIRTYSDPEHMASYQDTTEEESCPQCGNLFRGDWDKQQIGEETICYICSNQATEGLPDRLKEDRAVSRNPATENRDWAGSMSAEIPEGPIEEKFWLFDPESDAFKKMIYVLAFGMIFLTIFLVMFTDMDTPSSSDQSIAEYESKTGETLEGEVLVEPELPGWANVIYWVIRLFFLFVGQFLGLYMVLSLTDRLPHEKLIPNLINIGIAMGLMTLVTIGYFVFAATLGSTMMGPLLMMIPGVICLFLLIGILISILDFRIRDFFYLIFISGFAHSFMWMISLFFYTGLRLIAL